MRVFLCSLVKIDCFYQRAASRARGKENLHVRAAQHASKARVSRACNRGFARRGTHLRAHEFQNLLVSFCTVRYMEKINKKR